MNLGCIALGMLQILAIKYPHRVWKKYRGWKRTVRCEIPSEGIVLSVIRDEFDYFNAAFGKTEIHRIIAEKKREKEYLRNISLLWGRIIKSE
ncbi:MAG: hypothetical protein C4554_04700 [Dethiobacter sp.]|nr:MAG: hypothetical protein C4554_04700 [Dethiobacter sp.]